MAARSASRPAASRSAATPRVVAPSELFPNPIVLVTGAEELLADRAIATYAAAVTATDAELTVERLDASTYEAGQLEQLSSPSLFGGGTLVIARRVEAAADAFVADATALLTSCTTDEGLRTPDGVWLALVHGGGNRAKPLLDAARRAGAPEVVCAPITKDEEKVEFAAAEFARLGRRATPQAVRALVDAVGSDLRELAAACHQLASDGDEGVRIEADQVEQWFGGRVEVTGFRVADAAVAGRADQALALLRHALATGADPVPLVAAVAAKVRAMAKVSAAGRGRSVDLASALGMAPWQVDRARRDLSGWSESGMARAILALAEADTAVKGGGRDPVYAVERAVLTVAGARRQRDGRG